MSETEVVDTPLAQATTCLTRCAALHAASVRQAEVSKQSFVTLRADARAVPIASGVASCVVISPPYLGQRNYGDDEGEIGRCETVASYIEEMVAACSEIRRILRPDGTLWLNEGDKANGSGGAGGDYNKGGSKAGKPKYGKFYDPAYAKGQFLDVPGKVVAALQNDGWRLRLPIVWDKGQESREDLKHVKRPRWSHEMLYMLAPTKAPSRFFPDAIPETGSVWHFKPAQSERKGHPAPFPDELAERCILASTEPDDLVVDTFNGSGTVTRIARALGRRAVGTDLYA